MEKKNVWINVNDRLPDDYERVLFVTRQRRVCAGGYDALKKIFEHYGPCGAIEFSLHDVKYWMPFPKAPEVYA